MSTRIRYDENEDGTVLTSRRHFALESGVEVKVELDTVNKKYRVLDAVTQQELATGGDTVNLSVLKIQAKQALTDLGVNFGKEERKRDGASTGPVSLGS